MLSHKRKQKGGDSTLSSTNSGTNTKQSTSQPPLVTFGTGGPFKFGTTTPTMTPTITPSAFSFGTGTPGAVTNIKSNEWTATRSTKDLDNFLKLNNGKSYDFRDNLSFTKIEGIEVAVSQENKDIFLFRGNPVYCDTLDFQKYLDKPVWFSNFNVAAAYATQRGSVIGYKVSKQLNLFVLSNVDNIRALLNFYKDKKEDLNVIRFATGIDLKLEEHKDMFHEEFKGLFKWNEPQNGHQPHIRRVGITATDTKLLEKIKEYCENMGIYVDGYYCDQVFTPMTTHPFHEEICLFAPRDRVNQDRTKSKCMFATGPNTAKWGGKIKQQDKIQSSKIKK